MIRLGPLWNLPLMLVCPFKPHPSYRDLGSIWKAGPRPGASGRLLAQWQLWRTTMKMALGHVTPLPPPQGLHPCFRTLGEALDWGRQLFLTGSPFHPRAHQQGPLCPGQLPFLYSSIPQLCWALCFSHLQLLQELLPEPSCLSS